MVSKNFQYDTQPQQLAPLPYEKPLLNYVRQLMYNTSQIPDNPGYVDFNKPIGGVPNAKKKNKNKKNAKSIHIQQQQTQQKMVNWNARRGLHHAVGDKFTPNVPFNRFNNRQNVGGPARGCRMPPMRFDICSPPLPPPPPPHGFQPPIIPPMPFMPPMGCIQPPPPPFFGRGMPMPLPPPMYFNPQLCPPPMPFKANGKIQKPKLTKNLIKTKSTIKTLKNLINNYPLQKPWVTEEIRLEHNKKNNIENLLKGNKDDDLFAQFKTQRDKFVTMYEKARSEYFKKTADALKAKDKKDKQTINKNDTKDETNKEEIPKTES